MKTQLLAVTILSGAFVALAPQVSRAEGCSRPGYPNVEAPPVTYADWDGRDGYRRDLRWEHEGRRPYGYQRWEERRERERWMRWERMRRWREREAWERRHGYY